VKHKTQPAASIFLSFAMSVAIPLVSALTLLFSPAAFFAVEIDFTQKQITRGLPALPQFIDVTAAAGIDWRITKIATGNANVIETMGGGGGFVDYNNDGHQDVYLVCYSQEIQPHLNSRARDTLYRNNGDGTFTDVTTQAGINNSARGMGLAVGDYDNDGWADLYLTGYGGSRLYHNNRNGTFTELAETAKVTNVGKWGTSAAWFDADADGWLDLFVCNYLDFDPAGNTHCTLIHDRPYCSIGKLKGSSSKLYRNNRDGTFTDISAKSGIASAQGKGLGVIAFDYNNDNRIDIFQANDAAANFLYLNQGDGTFRETALEAGVAYDPSGNTRGGMGVDAEDVDGDGFLDFFVANFSGETNAYFHNNRDGTFNETTYEMNLGAISLPMSGFGVRFLDFDNDGSTELFVVNGHPYEPINKLFPNTTYAEPPFLFRFNGKQFSDVTPSSGEALRRMYPGRGLATADYDSDGDTDALIMNIGAPPVLLRNDGGNRGNWLGVRLVGKKSARDGTGAKITVTYSGKRQWRQLIGGTSYCSASDARFLFGIGVDKRIDELQVKWLSGRTTTLKNLSVNRYITITENVD
jgi:hypothetical protein